MKNKCNKIEQTCATPTFATCVSYEGEVNEVSPLSDDCSISTEEALQDIYTQLEEINLSELGETCLNYVETDEGRIIVKNVLLKLGEEICLLKEEVLTLKNRQLCDLPIGECVTSLDCLELPCEVNIITLGDWMNAVTAKLCETP